MTQAPPLPNLLNLIFHGPWGFLVGRTSITAYAPDCACHTYLMGDSPVLSSMPPGQYSFAAGQTVAPNPVRSDLHQTQIALRSKPSPQRLRFFQLPRTSLCAGRYAARLAVGTGDIADNLLNGADFSGLNHTDSSTKVVLAANQILPYAISDPGKPVLSGPGGTIWKPSQNFNQGRPSINLHIFAQAISAPSPGTTPGAHFSAMATLFGFALGLAEPAETVLGVNNSPLPPGVTDEDLAGLGKSLVAMRYDPYPFLCGGNLIVCDGGTH